MNSRKINGAIRAKYISVISELYYRAPGGSMLLFGERVVSVFEMILWRYRKLKKIGVLKVGRVVPCKAEKMNLCGSLLTIGYRLSTIDQRLMTNG